MKPYAIIEAGGKQYRVCPGDNIRVELMSAEPSSVVELKPVLAVGGDDGLKIGAPALAEAKVTATVLKHMRGPKLVSFKMKRRKGYARKKGHRQELTVLKIEAIQ